MSRTFRKRKYSFEVSNGWRTTRNWCSDGRFTLSPEEEKRERGKFNADQDTSYDWFNLPHEYRNMINRQRRSMDKEQLYKELNIEEHTPNYCEWNCKTGNPWGYW